jgi:putative nucleotidyltransferase with HDIG domain
MDRSVRAEGEPVLIPVVLVCDAQNERPAKAFATKLGVPAVVLETLRPGQALAAESVVVDINLRDFKSVELLKRLLDPAASIKERYFLIDGGNAERLLQVQANALGATRHVPRATALAELRREFSMAAGGKVAEKQPAPKSTSGGDASIARAGQSLADLFDGVLSDGPVSVTEVSAAGVDVLESVSDVGADQWLDAVRKHHEGTFQHCLMVTGVAASYASTNGLSPIMAKALVNAALLHDIGKAVIPRHVLDKPDKLTPEEFAIVKRHPRAGHDYLKKHAAIPAVVLDAVLHHHEALDGSGYPDGLRGTAILPMTRVLTVCDVFAALTEWRPYKETKTTAEAISILVEMAISSKVDYVAVRNLAAGFKVELPASFQEVVRNLVRSPRTPV